MPKLKPSPIDEASETIMRNISAVAEINGCKTDKAIAKKIGMPASTFSTRRSSPCGLRLEEIIMISEVFKCSLSWLVSDHRRETKE